MIDGSVRPFAGGASLENTNQHSAPGGAAGRPTNAMHTLHYAERHWRRRCERCPYIEGRGLLLGRRVGGRFVRRRRAHGLRHPSRGAESWLLLSLLEVKDPTLAGYVEMVSLEERVGRDGRGRLLANDQELPSARP